MNANTQQLHALGQSLWIDNITRQMLDDRTLERYIAELSITGLTSNPTTFEHAIGKGSAYDDQIAELAREGRSGYIEALAARLQREGADAFAKSWKCLLVGIADKTSQLNGTPAR